MSERANLATKASESKTNNRVSKTHNTSTSQTAHSPIDHIMTLQRTIGNQAVQRMLNSGIIQAKLRIGQPNDRYEQEADRVADQVMRMPESSNSISPMANGGGGKLVQRQGGDEELQEQPEEKEGLQAKSISEQITPLIQRQEEEDEEVQTKPVIQREVDDEEPIQTKFIQRNVVEEDESVQTKHADDSQVQRKVSEDMLPPEAKQEVELAKVKRDSQVQEDEDLQQMPIRRQGISGEAEGGASMASAAAQAISTKGPGEPMQNSTRDALESRMGMDLSDVRVHSDSTAQEAAKNLNARAFTNKRDIWLGAGQSQDNLSLMAHEATHVVQQSGNVQRRVVQRAVKKSGEKERKSTDENSDDPNVYSGKEGTIDVGPAKKITIPLMKVPTFKKKFVPATFFLPKKTAKKRPNDQREIWESKMRAKDGIDKVLKKRLKEGKAPKVSKGGKEIYYLELQGAPVYVFGTRAAIKTKSLRPYWDKSGKVVSYHVDHQNELQLGGANKIDNMWLLEGKANVSSGQNIRIEKNKRIQNVLDAAKGNVKKKVPSLQQARKSYAIEIKKIAGGLDVDGDSRKRWTKKEIGDDARQLHYKAVKVLNKTELIKAGFLTDGKPKHVLIFTNEKGGGVRPIKWKNVGKKGLNIPFGNNFKIQEVTYNPGKGGKIFGTGFAQKKKGKKVVPHKMSLDFDINEIDAVDYGGYVSAVSVDRTVKSKLKEIKGSSPFAVHEAGLDPVKGIWAHGTLSPSIPIFSTGIEINTIIDGNDVFLSKTFDAGVFSFPGPVQVTDSSLTFAVGTGGLKVNGDIYFEVAKLGKGELRGYVVKKFDEDGSALGLKGKFEFDTELFDKAEIRLGFENNKFSGGGTLRIKKGKVKGIKSASIDINVDGEKWNAKGSVQPGLPGVKQADLEAKYDPEHGLVIGGKLDLSEDIPRVKGGSIEAKVTQKEDGKYKVEAGGRADLDIPGVDASVDVKYDDGMFLAKGTVGYKKGMLEGSITAGATNMAVSEDGVVLPGEPGKKLQPFGRGTASVKIAPWLKGTIGIKLKPNGEVEVAGEVGLPSSLEIFKKRPYKKNIFETPSIDIPILGFVVPVIKKRVGVFATIKGGMDAEASIGPGELTDLSLSITYNPQREEDTLVHGKASLQIPAKAGLSLYVKGGIGAGIPIVSAEAGLKVTGGLGIEGAATAAVEVDWTPAKGLVLDANANIYAEPKFKFGIDAYALVEVELPWPFDDRTLYDETWNLANFEYGSGLRFGLLFPFHYEEGKTPDIALDDIEFQAPKIGVKDVISGIVKQII